LMSYNTIGFQATGLSRAIQIVEEMVLHPQPYMSSADE
jgi:deoxyhypusine synthase